MYDEANFYDFFICFIGGGFLVSLVWLGIYKIKIEKIKLNQKYMFNEDYVFNQSFTIIKNVIDHIQAPILLIVPQYANSVISLRNQIKQNFSLSNSIAYEKNIYMNQHYADVVLDILRHPVFCHTIENYDVSPATEIEIHIELPKVYHFKLYLCNYELSTPLKHMLVITIVDQSQAISLNQMRSDFIAHASHELRTPLTSLDGFIQTLLTIGVEDSQTQKQFLEIMQSQVGRMIRLSNGLLTLSRVERDEYQLLTKQVDLKQVLQQIFQEIQVKIKQAGIRFEFQDQVKAQTVNIFADKDQLFQIFHNIMENAIRYPPLGQEETSQIILRLSFVHDDLRWPGTGYVVSIIDNGPGIEKCHLPRLTERFYRADDKNSGTGLGLAIVKHLVTRHKGVMVIESEIGQGSCFSIWFPSVKANDKDEFRSGAVGED